MSNIQSVFFLLVSTLLTTACSSNSVVVLIPDPDGSVGSIVISNRAGSVELNKPNQAAEIQDRETAPASPVELKKKEIDSLFSEALAIQPPPPVDFMLFFEKDSVQLKPDSVETLAVTIAAIRKRDPAEISIAGHADALGRRAYNMRLSKRRALAVRELLVKSGVQKEQIKISFHGEEMLLIKTKDNVGNPKNRRAEITVR